MVTRGALPEAEADEVNYPGTYVAGLYDRAETEVAGRMVENEDLVNVPNWLPLRFRIAGGEWFEAVRSDVAEHRFELDMRRGVLTRHLTWQDAEGRRTSMTQRRFVSMKDEHLAGLLTTFTAENWSGRLEVSSGLDGRVVNAGVKRYKDLNGRHLQVLGQGRGGPGHDRPAGGDAAVPHPDRRGRADPGAARRTAGRGRPATGRGARVHRPRARASSSRRGVRPAWRRSSRSTPPGIAGSPRAGDDARLDRDARPRTSPTLLARHEGAWNSLWNRFDIELDSANEWTETVLHLHILHLLQTVSPHTEHLDVGVPARGWNGEAYRGHIFWDEMFIFPFLNFQRPILANALLQYRHARLGVARAAARAAGYEGAMFPWQSGCHGREETQEAPPEPEVGALAARPLAPPAARQHRDRLQRLAALHGDRRVSAFLRFTGAELLIEIARFWSSIATYDADEDRYEIHGVMGPDEYHEAYPDSAEPGLRNNTYTNVMAVWVLQRALEALDVLPPHYRAELVQELTIRDDELDRWRDISRKMKVVFHGDGVLTQFEGYEDLPRVRLGGLPGAVREHPAAGPAAGGRGRQHEPVQAGQAGRRPHAAFSALP